MSFSLSMRFPQVFFVAQKQTGTRTTSTEQAPGMKCGSSDTVNGLDRTL